MIDRVQVPAEPRGAFEEIGWVPIEKPRPPDFIGASSGGPRYSLAQWRYRPGGQDARFSIPKHGFDSR